MNKEIDMRAGLWLDDVRSSPDDNMWCAVSTAAACIAQLDSGFFERVSLDHDLGAAENGTGYDVLLWLEQQIATGIWRARVPELLVHSANPVGVNRMRLAIASIKKLAQEKGLLCTFDLRNNK